MDSLPKYLIEAIYNKMDLPIGSSWKSRQGEEFKIKGDKLYLNITGIDWAEVTEFYYDLLIQGDLEPSFKPTLNESFYIPAPHLERMYDQIIWTNSRHDRFLLSKGMIFKTIDESITATKEMWKIL